MGLNVVLNREGQINVWTFASSFMLVNTSAMTKQLKLQHILWRAGFGPALHDKNTWLAMPEQDWWPAIRKALCCAASNIRRCKQCF